MLGQRILYTAFDVVPGPKGSSTHITAFLQGLATAGFQVDLLTPGDGNLPATGVYAGATVTRIPLDPTESMLRRALRFDAAVVAHLVDHAYDLVHFRSLWGGLAVIRGQARYGYRTLFEVNGLPSIELKYHYPALSDGSAESAALLGRLRAQEQALLTASDLVICPSAVTATFVASLGADPNRLLVIPNGAEPCATSVLPLRESTPPTLLYIGTLADWQGLGTLLAALPMVLALQPVRLRIVGSGRARQRRALLKLATKLGVADAISVEEPVSQREVAALIAAADLCVAPLAPNDRNVTQGCCPIKLIEYMACGRPIIAANLPVVRELLREDGDGLLFVPGDSRDLARAILTLLSEPELATRLARSAAARARACFTWDHARERLLAAYARLCSAQQA
ncbi:MAG: glycosyltransferase family 4 protein [Oscillochloris sp.]|nr:glycosyltransferase family 4 protein [Oscillochloris sp.]